MFFTSSNQHLTSKCMKLIPDMEQLLKTKFVNYITMNTSSIDSSWTHSGKVLHPQHALALGFLQCNFKNHIVNKVGVERVKQVARILDQNDHQDLFMFLWPKSQKKLHPSLRKCFYIFDHNHKIDELMHCTLMRNKNFQKVLCFQKTQPLQVNPEFEKFCFEYNIQALGLTNFSLKSLLTHLYHKTNHPTLIHELIDKDENIYKDQTGSCVPLDLILFMNRVQKEKLRNNHFPTFKQILVKK